MNAAYSMANARCGVRFVSEALPRQIDDFGKAPDLHSVTGRVKLCQNEQPGSNLAGRGCRGHRGTGTSLGCPHEPARAIVGSARQARIACEISLFRKFIKRMFGKAKPRQAVGSNSSVGNLRTRRAVHTFMVWAGRLSSTGDKHAAGITFLSQRASGAF